MRARRSDIPLLAEHLLARFARQMDTRVRSISDAAMEVLVAYDWPGNVRELSNAIERAMVVGKGPAIQPADLPLRNHTRTVAASDGDSLAEVEKRHIAAVLERTEWNISAAAQVLGIDRVTVYNKIRKYGLSRPE